MSSEKLIYSKDELLADHPYAKRQSEAGLTLHGGFDAAGVYLSPRTYNRWPAVKAWQKQLSGRGFPLVEADQKLLSAPNFPSSAQQKLLVKNGLSQTLSDALTITGVIEGKGVALVSLQGPDFQDIIKEDISQTALGHLNKGLMAAHGMDEGGRPDSDEGGHDVMWFAVRDVLFGKGAYPEPAVPDGIARASTKEREMPQIPPFHEMILNLLTNVLMIEVRAERFFSFCQSVFMDPELFLDRREGAELASEIVERIRQDEAIHVAYLQLAVSEFRSFTVKTKDGGEVPGSEILDPYWEGMVKWHSDALQQVQIERQRKQVVEMILAHENGEALLKDFNSLAS